VDFSFTLKLFYYKVMVFIFRIK